MSISPPSCCPAGLRRLWAFTLTELLVVIAIVAFLAALIIPAIAGARSKACTTKTMSNLRQLQVANIGYAQDNDGVYVSAFDGGNWDHGWKWNETYLSHLSIEPSGGTEPPILRSGFSQKAAIIAYNVPKVPGNSGYDYYWSGGAKLALRQNQVERPDTTIAFLDANDWWVDPDQWSKWKGAAHDLANNPHASVAYRNNGKAAAVTYAGTIVMLSRDELDPNKPEGQWRWYFDGRR